MSTICIVRDKAFKELAKQANVSEDALERIWHKLANEQQDDNIVPSIEYIQQQYKGTNIVSSQGYEQLHNLWEQFYSTPFITNSLDQAQQKKAEYEELFKSSAVKIKPLNNGTYQVSIAEPTLIGTIVTSAPSQIYEEGEGQLNSPAIDFRLQSFAARQSGLFRTKDGRVLSNKNREEVTVQDLLSLVKDSAYSTIVELLEKLDKLGELNDIKIELLDSSTREMGRKRAYYDADYRTIYINANATYENGDASSVILHEILHPLTIDRIQQNPELRKEIQSIIDEFQSVEENFTPRYLNIGENSHHIEEFIADVWSNKDTIEKLKRTKTKENKNKNLWERFKNFLQNLFSGVFSGTTDNSLMAKASSSIIKLLETQLTISASGKYFEGEIVYNKEQEEAISATVDHIKNVIRGKADSKFYTIQGKAGTGKTTIVNEILNRVSESSSSFYAPTVIMGALSLKATAVLQNKITPEVARKYRFQFKSIAGMLGMRPQDDGSFAPIKGQRPPIQGASIIFIDEASMVNEEQLSYIQEAIKGRNIPVVFLGDVGQLPPIRMSKYYRNKNISQDKISPIFEDKKIGVSKLVTRVRQGESSPVLEYADNYWNYSEEKRKEYPNDLDTTSAVTDNGALIVQRNEIKLTQQLISLFEEAKETGNPNLVKIVAYRNETVDRYNFEIRRALYPDLDNDNFQKGDLIIFNETFGDESSSIPNSWESAIIETRECDSDIISFLTSRGVDIDDLELEEVDREYIKFKGPNGGEYMVPALINTAKNKKTHSRNIQSLRKFRDNVFHGKYGNKYSYRQAKELLEYYQSQYAANVGYAYAITTHKSQGSTYEVVAVDAADINDVRDTSLKTKSRSIYTGLTRASNITIVSSNTTNEDVIYTDKGIKDINDRINAVKRGEEVEEDFIPDTEENPFFAEVTEDDLGNLIKGLKKSTKKSKSKREDVEGSDIGDPRYHANLPEIDPDEDLMSWDDLDDDNDESEETPTRKAKIEKKKQQRKQQKTVLKRTAKEDVEDTGEDSDIEELTEQEKTYREFIAKQRQLSSTVKFKKASHTYIVNGKKADFSVTEFKDFILGVDHDDSTFLKVAGKLGSSHDAVLRDFFDPDTDVAVKYPNLTKEQIRSIKLQGMKLRNHLRSLYGDNAIFITDESLLRVAMKVNYNGRDYTVAGTIDMVVIDEDGNLHIIDFKTKRANRNKELSNEKEEEYGTQLALYKGGMQSYLISLKNRIKSDTQIAQFNIKYDNPEGIEYSFDNDQVYVKVGRKNIPIQESSSYSPGKLYAVIPLLEPLEDVKIRGIKTTPQEKAEAKNEAEETRVNPKEFSGQMISFYGKYRRKGVRSTSTLYAIREGVRTATTRYESDGHISYWKKAKKGDIITFRDNNGEEVRVRVTVPLHKLSKDTDPEEWSEKEGWNTNYFNTKVKPRLKEAWQMEYELVKNEDNTSKKIEINSYSKKFGLLSNFGDKPFEVDGKQFDTVEHYFHYKKAASVGNWGMANKILNASTAKQAKYLGSHVLEMSKREQAEWDTKSRRVMKRGMREAFEQNEDAKELLLSTGKALLTHKLGGPFADILMELREEFGGYGKPETIEQATKRAKEVSKEAKKVPEATTKETNKDQKNNKDEWTKVGDKKIKISTKVYKKGDPQSNPDTAYIFTENAEAYSFVHDIDLGVNFPHEKDPKINVSDMSRTDHPNQAGIRTDSEGNISENAFGIIVKKYQQGANGKFVYQEGTFKDTDDDFTLFQMLNEDMFDRLEESGLKNIIFPSQMAMGNSALPKRFAEWLANELYSRYKIQTTIQERGNNNKGYEGYGLVIDSIEGGNIDSALHIEKKDNRYTPQTSSNIESFNTAARELRSKGWHIEFYRKKSKDGSRVNDIMTISLRDNPGKGFFELVKDQEENQYSVHFKTRSKKAMNESEFAEEALEDKEKENMFKALIFAIPEGGIVSTWGTLSKGGIKALDTLGDRSEGVLVKVGDRTIKEGDGLTLIPVYKKLTEEERIDNFINKAKVEVRASKNQVLSKVEEDPYYKLHQANVEDPIYTGVFKIILNEPELGEYERPNVTDGSKDEILSSQVRALPYSSILTIERRYINPNYLYTLNYLLSTKALYPVWSTDSIIIPKGSVEESYAKEYAKTNKNFKYDFKTGELKIPRFTVGYNLREIKRRKASDTLLSTDVLTQSELRQLSKATVYKVSEYITQLQTYPNAYEKLFGEANSTDFTKLSRIEIINKIGLSKLFNLVKGRVFDSEVRDNVTRKTRKKMNVIYNNWEAFCLLGYDTLINIEEIAFDEDGNATRNFKNELNNIQDEDESTVQELFGSSLEHWQVGFRQVSAYSGLSNMIKRVLDSFYELDTDYEQIENEFGLAKHLIPQEAVSKILSYTQGSTSLDKRIRGELDEYSMLYKLKQHLDTDPWIKQLIELLEDQYDEEGNLTKKADEQFKSQFYSNFQKYFQRYAITFKDNNNAIQVKIINENQYADIVLKQSQARENSAALGEFKLKNKDGSLNKVTLSKLEKLLPKLEKVKEEVKGKDNKINDYAGLDEYHNTLSQVFDLLDIDTPDSYTLNKIFSIKKNLSTLIFKLEHLINGIKENPTSITNKKDYKDIVELVSKESGLEMESVSYEAGKLYYSYVMPSYLGRLVDKLKKENMSDLEYEEFMQQEYLKYPWFYKNGKVRSYWLRKLRSSKETRANFGHVTSLHYLGTEYVKKTPVEYIASMFKMFMYDSKNKKWAYYRVPTLSNKPSEEYIKFERIHTAFKPTILNHLWDVFLQELDRIQATRERTENIEEHQRITSKGKSVTFDKNGLRFVILDFIQPYLDGSFEDRVDFDTLTDKEQSEEYEFHTLLNDKLNGELENDSRRNARLIRLFNTISERAIKEKYEEAKQQWIDEGFITLNKKGKIDKTFNNMKLTENDLEEFFWNDLFAATQILELTITDPAYYKDAEDLQKRLAQIHAPGMQANILAKDRDGNLYTKDGKERTMYIKDDMVKSSIATNLKQAIKQIIASTPSNRKEAVARQLNNILEAFNKINFADAQAFSCPSSYRKKMGIFGNWSDRDEDAYQALMHPEKYPDISIADILDVLWQPLKPFVYTQIEKPGYNSILSTIKVPVQNKNSEYVLIMADALMRRAGIPNKLMAIYDFMEESQHNEAGELNGVGIDTIQFMSAVNSGCLGVLDLNDIRDKNGNVTHYKTEEEIKQELGKAYTISESGEVEYNIDYVHEIPFEDYIIQQNVPSHFASHEQAHGSQDRILTFADIADIDPKTGETNYLEIDGKKVSVKEAKANYFKAIADNIEISKQKLIKRFNLDSADEREKNIAISRVLKDAILRDSRLGTDLLWACDTNEFGEFNIPLSDPIQSTRIQQLLNSVIKNTINKQEIAGGPIVQVSSWGTSDQLNIRWQSEDGQILLTESEFNSGIFPSDYGKVNKAGKNIWKQVDGYGTYEEYIQDQAGVAYFEAFIPVQDTNIVKDFMKRDSLGNEYIDVEAMAEANPDLLNMVGYRIPTESKYSMAPIRVKGFLPRNAGEGIMLPADITTLAGSDFDIDKMYIMYYAFTRSEKDGKIVYTKPKSGKEYNDNLIISTQLAVLRSKQVRQQLFTPGNFDEPKKYGYLISYVQEEASKTGRDPQAIWEEAKNWDNDTLKDRNKRAKNLIYNNVQVQFHKQNMVAAKLIGIFAQANVSHAFISLGDSPYIAIPSELEFTLNGVRIGGDTPIDSVYTLNNETFISNNLAAFLAASVDAVKDPILNLININDSTANIVVSMLRLGFSIETVGLLCSQPILKDLIRDFSIRRASKRISIQTVLNSYLDKLKKDIGEIDDLELDDKTLIANLNGESDTTNYVVLRIFENLLAISDTFGDITHMTRYNSITSAVGPFAANTMVLKIKDSKFANNSMISDSIREACDNPILVGFREASYEIESKILGEHLIQAGETFFNALKQLGTTLGYSRGVSEEIANKFSDFYMSFYVNAGFDGQVFDLSYENRKVMLTKFPKDFKKIKSRYNDNILINSILYVENEREQYPFLTLKTRGLSPEILEDMRKAWTALYNDEETRGLAIRLAEYNFFRGSFGFSPKTFMNNLPNVVKQGLSNYINTLNNRSSRVEEESTIVDRIIYQFILHNTDLITDSYFKLSRYNPETIYSDSYGECILLEKDPEDPKVRGIQTSKPFIEIDGDYYFVVSQDVTFITLKKVDSLGGNGQGFEISINNNFPKTIYKSTLLTSEDGQQEDEDVLNIPTDSIDKEVLGVIVDQLYNDDQLQDIIAMSPAKAFDVIRGDLNSKEAISIEPKGRYKKMLMEVMKEVKGVEDANEIRNLLNKANKSIKDLKLCN